MRAPLRFGRRPRTDQPSGDTGRLLAAARSGDAVALAALRADLDAPTVALLAGPLGAVGLDPVEVLAAARACADRPEVLEQVVVVLLDGTGRSPALVAEVLDLPVPVVLAAREAALARCGTAAAPPGCRGWLLVARADRLTPEERAAAEAHLGGCRRCAAARAASVQALRRAPAAVPAPRSAPAGARR